MLSIKQLPSRNLDVRAYHIIKNDAPVGVMIEDRNLLDRAISTWNVLRIRDWTCVAFFQDCNAQEALEQAETLKEELFDSQVEHDRYYQRVITGYGRKLNYCVTDGDAHLASHQKELMDFAQGKQRVADQYFKQFVDRELLETGDWPIEFQVVNDRTHEVLISKVVGEPAP